VGLPLLLFFTVGAGSRSWAGRQIYGTFVNLRLGARRQADLYFGDTWQVKGRLPVSTAQKRARMAKFG